MPVVMWLQHWLQNVHQGGMTGQLIGAALIFVVSFLPVIPIPLITSVMGASGNFWMALGFSWGAAAFGAVCKYWLIRSLLHHRAEWLLKRYRGSERLLNAMVKHGFSLVLLYRLIPVFPSSVINVAAGLAGISARAFVVATFLGKLPVMFVFCLAGKQAAKHLATAIVIALLYILLTGIAGIHLRRTLRQAGPVTESSSK